MIPGFVHVTRAQFYCEVWPRIKQDIDVIHSTAASYRKTGALPLVIYWGHKHELRDDTTIVAVSYGNAVDPDEHWVDPALIGR